MLGTWRNKFDSYTRKFPTSVTLDVLLCTFAVTHFSGTTIYLDFSEVHSAELLSVLHTMYSSTSMVEVHWSTAAGVLAAGGTMKPLVVQ